MNHDQAMSAKWKDNAYRWRDLYTKLRDETGTGDTAEVVRAEGQTRRLAEIDALGGSDATP